MAPNSPARNEALSNGIGILDQRLQVYHWAVFFCFLPRQLREVHVHICIQHCLHPRTTPAWEAMLGCKWWQAGRSAEVPPHHDQMTQGAWWSKAGGLGFSSLKWCPKCRRAKPRPEGSPYQEAGRTKNDSLLARVLGAWGFFLASWNERLPIALFLHRWSLGSFI